MYCRCVRVLLSQLVVRFLITLHCLCTRMVSMSWVPPPWWSTRPKKGNTHSLVRTTVLFWGRLIIKPFVCLQISIFCNSWWDWCRSGPLEGCVICGEYKKAFFMPGGGSNIKKSRGGYSKNLNYTPKGDQVGRGSSRLYLTSHCSRKKPVLVPQTRETGESRA